MSPSTPARLENPFPPEDVQRALFVRLAAGDEAAFDTIFRTWYAPLVRIATYLLHDQGTAEEVVQDVLLEVWRRRESLALEREPRRYLMRATRNRALNHVRHEAVVARAAARDVSEESHAATAPSRVDAQELEQAIAQAVDTLPERCRAVFELSRRHHMSYAQIADALDIAPKTVENQMGRALRMLRVALASWLPDGNA
ncbi:MAG TPA: RNA polymerase sigma-70 factor [Gemmatimonadaceae bacterium]|nr:RNA polymerase sigma-70 factor [Gemmatimonadaceae bacterium]